MADQDSCLGCSGRLTKARPIKLAQFDGIPICGRIETFLDEDSVNVSNLQHTIFSSAY